MDFSIGEKLRQDGLRSVRRAVIDTDYFGVVRRCSNALNYFGDCIRLVVNGHENRDEQLRLP
jgi:hypothetical protein